MKIADNRLRSVQKYLHLQLDAIYPSEEVDAFFRLAADALLNIPPNELLLNRDRALSESELLKFIYLVKSLKLYMPVQYAIGIAWFLDMKFKVNPHVLIPRPETEELVLWAIGDFKDHRNEPEVIDLGTGSGCIAVALKKHLPGARITAVDISADAISVASENALKNDVLVNFLEGDIRKHELLPRGPFDIIISNPPYIPEGESEQLGRNVRGYEPHLALFTPADDPLYFYRQIIAYASDTLGADGKLYLELHESFAGDVKAFADQYFKNVTLKQDIHQKNRMLCASR